MNENFNLLLRFFLKFNIISAANDRSQLLSMFNDIAYESPASNLLTQSSSYQAICKRNQLSTCTEPCTCAQIIKTKLNNVVELVMYDASTFHDCEKYCENDTIVSWKRWLKIVLM